MKKITVLIPCYNEEKSIAAVVNEFPREELAKHGYVLDVLVIDNNSKDKTAFEAKKAGARVISELKQGKGHAIRRGFMSLEDDTDYVVMLDGDDTYKPREILRLVEPINNGFCDVIIGSRMAGKIKPGSMKKFNLLGNWTFSFLVRVFYRVNVTDVLTGYFAWKREVVEKLSPNLVSSGFAIEMEMITKMARMGSDIYSVPITYEPRLGDSSLRPIHDGSRILKMFAKNLKWSPRTTRIAFVSDTVYPFNKGGKERRLYEISRRLVTEGREVTIYTMKWWSGKDSTIVDGVRLEAISKNRPLYKDSRRSITQAVLFGLACFKLINKPFDIVDVDHMPFFPLFSVRIVTWIRRKKMYATWHEVWGHKYWMEYIGGISGIIGSITEKLSFILPNLIITNSDHTTQLLLATGKNPRKIETIPLGVDIDKIDSATASIDERDIIFVGRLLPNKNVNLLIDAIRLVKVKNPTVSCLIVGDGPEKPSLLKQINDSELQENVTIAAGIESDAELYGLMKSAKVFVLPSTREGFGLVALEANACGIPVITTNHMNNASRNLILEGKNGYTVAPDAYDIAKTIEKTLSAKKLNAREVLDTELSEYNWDNVTNKLELVFDL